MQTSLKDSLRAHLDPHETSRAQALLQSLEAGDHALSPLLRQKPLRDFLLGVCGNSAYLSRIIEREPDLCAWCLEENPQKAMEEIFLEVAKAPSLPAIEDAMRQLRHAKQRMALFAALLDIGEAWSLEETMRALSSFADKTLQAALQWILTDALKQGLLTSDAPEESGFVILALGKLGARELNYSSDIDPVIFYDREAPALKKGVRAEEFFPRCARTLVRIMQEMTSDGYVFRTDIRLRPDPGATAAAVSLPAAIQYYQDLGQHWERAAFIRARPVAGDIAKGAAFLKEIESFIWRKYLDFAAIEDMQAMKRQVERQLERKDARKTSSRKGRDHALSGLDIKRARGGIRDIEFFVHTQQLIAGGRDTLLRRVGLADMLGRLCARRWISPDAAREMAAAYRFFRVLEHRLQMMEDAQTHTLPRTEEGFTHLARFMNSKDKDALLKDIQSHRQSVSKHFQSLFEKAPALGGKEDPLLFTGVEDDPDTLQSLQKMGFDAPQNITRTVRGWHAGRIAATRSAIARERLTRLIPRLLEALGKTADPDHAFLHFDRFLSHLPTAGQFFSLLESKPGFLNLISDICGTAPHLAEDLGKYPRMMEALLIEGGGEADLVLRDAKNYEEKLDALRHFAHEEKFRIGVELLKAHTEHRHAGKDYAHCAQGVIEAMQNVVLEEMARRHGKKPAGAKMAIVALGRLGAESMSHASDLDLIFLYEMPAKKERSAKETSWFIKWTQRFISAISVPTAAGALYDVDMRLRPSGRAGPVAVEVGAFFHYQTHEAELWEHMALTSARVLCADKKEAEKIEKAIHKILAVKRAPKDAAEDVLHLRKRIAKAQPPASHWDLRFAEGGIRDADFLRQYLQLIHAHKHPELLGAPPADILKRAQALKLLDAADLKKLLDAHLFMETLTQILALCLDTIFDPQKAPEALCDLLTDATSMKDFAALEAQLIKHQKQTFRLFRAVIGDYREKA